MSGQRGAGGWGSKGDLTRNNIKPVENLMNVANSAGGRVHFVGEFEKN